MRHAIGLTTIIALSVGVMAWAQQTSKESDVLKDCVKVYKTIGKSELSMELHFPEGHKASDRAPAIVFFFGGGWNGGTRAQFQPHCEYLAGRGMVAATADYRTRSSAGTSPKECVKDGKSAVRWLRAHAGELGINPHRLAAGGGSAGGHVAAATATLSDYNEEGEDTSVSCVPDALVLFNPVIDNGPGGYGYDRVKDYWQSFSPMHNLSEHTPPTLVMFGTKDHLVPVKTAEAYAAKMKELGGRCELRLYEGRGHGFFNATRSKKDYALTVIEMDRFLASLGYLKGEPTLKAPDDAKQ